MSLLKKNKKEVEFNNITMTPCFSPDTVHVSKEKDDEWIWVEGYKGTKKDMSTRYDFQYELNKRYEIDEEPEMCKRGFHFCKEFFDVFDYYSIGKNHRFFKVKALVKASHYDSYGTYDYFARINKLVAKAIILTEEIMPEDVIEEYYTHCKTQERLDSKYNELLIAEGYKQAWDVCYTRKLMNAGYTQEFAEYLIASCSDDCVKKAVAIGNLPGASMDLKLKIIFDK